MANRRAITQSRVSFPAGVRQRWRLRRRAVEFAGNVVEDPVVMTGMVVTGLAYGKSLLLNGLEVRNHSTAIASTISSRAARSAGGSEPSELRANATPANASTTGLGSYATSNPRMSVATTADSD